MSLENLHRRIDKLIAAIEQQQRDKPSISLHLLATSEQGQLEAFLAHLQTTYSSEPLSPETLHLVTDSELDRLEQWALLLNALDQENIGAASEHRRRLAAMPAA